MGTPKAKQDRKVDKDYVGADDPIIVCTARGGFPHQRHRFSAPLIAWFTSCDVSLLWQRLFACSIRSTVYLKLFGIMAYKL